MPPEEGRTDTDRQEQWRVSAPCVLVPPANDDDESYLLKALSISTVTSTDRARPWGMSLSKTLQSTPAK